MSAAPVEKPRTWVHHTCHISLSTGILAGLLVLAAISYYLVFADAVRQEEPMTAERARQIGCPITIPDTADRVRFAYIHGWFEHVTYVRYNADSTECRAQIKTVLEEHAASHHMELQQTKLEPITTPQKINEWGSLGPLHWFNIEKIVDGVTKTDSTGKITVWVDDDHGVFYCKITD
jgi:hypothetical protein